MILDRKKVPYFISRKSIKSISQSFSDVVVENNLCHHLVAESILLFQRKYQAASFYQVENPDYIASI
jgi:hypothetical protein